MKKKLKAYQLFTKKKRGLTTSGIASTAQETAYVMLLSLMALRAKHSYPMETPEDKITLYTHILRLRPGYDSPQITKVLSEAQQLSRNKGEPKGISLNTLVTIVVKHEYATDMGIVLNQNQMEAVDKALKGTY